MPLTDIATQFNAANYEGFTPGGAAGTNKLWLSLWGGMILGAYDQTNVFEALITNKPLTGGVSWEFPITGTVDLEPVWGAGEELGDDAGNDGATIVVSLDKRPMAAFFEVDSVTKMISQWDFVSELGRQAGLRLANTRDKQIAAYIARAAGENQIAITGRTFLFNGAPGLPIFGDSDDTYANRATGGYVGYAGSVTATTTDRTNAVLEILSYIEDWTVFLQENDLPTENLYCAVNPRVFKDIRSLGIARTASTVANSQPFFGGVAEAGGLGAPFTQGLNGLMDTLEYMGVTILKTNHMPKGYAAGEIGEAKYNVKGDFEGGDANGNSLDFEPNGGSYGIKALLWHPEAVAGLTLMGMKTDTVRDVRRNCDFSVASMHKGTGVLKPELACAICSAANMATVQAVTRGGSAAGSLLGEMGVTAEYANTASGTFPYA